MFTTTRLGSYYHYSILEKTEAEINEETKNHTHGRFYKASLMNHRIKMEIHAAWSKSPPLAKHYASLDPSKPADHL